jgi:hypothetical protein
MFTPGERYLRLDALSVTGTDTRGKRITAISFSENHAVALLSTGEALAIGDNTNGKLGIGDSPNATSFTLIQTSAPLVGVAAGSDFSLLLTASHLTLGCRLEPGHFDPIPLPIPCLVEIKAFRCSVVGITVESEVIFWQNFHEFADFRRYQLFTKPQTVACGGNFAAALLENGILARLGAGDPEYLYVASRVGAGGESFVAMSASEGYIIAIDRAKRAWIFGAFNGFAQRYLAEVPVFEDVTFVFAGPEYACGITSSFEGVGIGKLPGEGGRRLLNRAAKLPFEGMALGIVSGNENEIVAVPLFYTKEIAEEQIKWLFPPKLVAGLPIGK